MMGQNSSELCVYQIVKLGIKDFRKPVIEKTIKFILFTKYIKRNS